MRAAVERVGGDESVREALAPKQRSDGQTMKWSAVCCDAAQGLSAGDPVFTAWARLAVTPVREIKGLVDPRDRDGRGGAAAGAAASAAAAVAAAAEAATVPWRDRGQGGGGAGAEDMRQHGRDGSFKSRIRIVDMSKGRDEDGRRRGRGQEARGGRAPRPARLLTRSTPERGAADLGERIRDLAMRAAGASPARHARGRYRPRA